jgi:hypothetical protein
LVVHLVAELFRRRVEVGIRLDSGALLLLLDLDLVVVLTCLNWLGWLLAAFLLLFPGSLTPPLDQPLGIF